MAAGMPTADVSNRCNQVVDASQEAITQLRCYFFEAASNTARCSRPASWLADDAGPAAAPATGAHVNMALHFAMESV